MTYSIVARDADTGHLGVAVQSHFFGAGRVVPWAKAGVGAVATQAFANASFGPDGLQMLAAGTSPDEVLSRLLGADPGAGLRQIAVVDAQGKAAAYSGAHCYRFAAHETSCGVSAQGNMLRSAGTPAAMVTAFEDAAGDLADRLLAALLAAEAHGGDARGQQAAALMVVAAERDARPGPPLVDVRVEDSPEPLAELGRLLALSRGYDALGTLFGSDVLGGDVAPAQETVAAALASIDVAQSVLGDSAEPVMWRAIVLARAHRTDEARQAAAHAIRASSGLADFLLGLQAQGAVPIGTWDEDTLHQ